MFRTIRRSLTWVTLGLVGGAAVVTVRHLLDMPQPLQSALPGAGRIDREHGGELYYNVAGPEHAAPVVLLHDFAPGASNYEYRDVFPLFASGHRVYAPDWLGYGMSERPNIAYTGEFYASVLAGFLRDVVVRPATVIGLGRAANVIVRAASDSPDLFSRVVLVSPLTAAGASGEPTLTQTAVRATQRAFLGIVPYALLSTRPMLRWRAMRTSAEPGSGGASEAAVRQRYLSAHQFGGQYAPLAMLTGELDLPARNAFAVLTSPTLVVIGGSDPRRAVGRVSQWTSVNPRADLRVIPDAGYDVCEDQPHAFVQAVNRWIETLPPTAATAGDAALASAAASDERDERDERAIPGLPGYVVPGVSDMGQDGPAAVTIAGITTIEPEIELGPEPERTEQERTQLLQEEGLVGTPADLLPEAGDADPASRAEALAREGVNPPLEPETNIASVATAAQEIEAARGDETPPGSGEMPGRSQVIETPEMPGLPEAPGAEQAQPGTRAGPAGTNSEGTTPAAGDEAPTTPQPRVAPRAQSNAQAAPREPSAHTEGPRHSRTAGRDASTGGGAAGQSKPASKSQAKGHSKGPAKGHARGKHGGPH
ncbi:MAG: alpha/beta fold hydrolase [Ktedonobacterales bacterium]